MCSAWKGAVNHKEHPVTIEHPEYPAVANSMRVPSHKVHLLAATGRPSSGLWMISFFWPSLDRVLAADCNSCGMQCKRDKNKNSIISGVITERYLHVPFKLRYSGDMTQKKYKRPVRSWSCSTSSWARSVKYLLCPMNAVNLRRFAVYYCYYVEI